MIIQSTYDLNGKAQKEVIQQEFLLLQQPVLQLMEFHQQLQQDF
jgi:hypothetical protein